MPEKPDAAIKNEDAEEIAAELRDEYAHKLPTGPTADVYRLAGYVDGLVGASPECDLLKPHYDSGLKWPDKNNPKPDDPCWGRGIAGGIRWDGTFYRDKTRYPAGGDLFWSAYLKPGTAPGSKNGYWLNFGSGWSHLANDDFNQILTGASQRIYWESLPPASPLGGKAASLASGEGQWKLVIEATMFVTYAVVEVWTGIKQGGNDPTGTYTRISGCDPTATLTVEAQ